MFLSNFLVLLIIINKIYFLHNSVPSTIIRRGNIKIEEHDFIKFQKNYVNGTDIKELYEYNKRTNYATARNFPELEYNKDLYLTQNAGVHPILQNHFAIAHPSRVQASERIIRDPS